MRSRCPGIRHDATAAKGDALQLPDGTRTRYMIERGLKEHRETARRIAAGDYEYTAGIIAYAQQIYPREMSREEQNELVIRLAGGFAG